MVQLVLEVNKVNEVHQVIALTVQLLDSHLVTSKESNNSSLEL